MTGYAVATSEGAAGTLTIEIKSVNSRFLDLQFRINDELRALEPDLRSAIMAAITRGKVEVRLSFGRKAATAGTHPAFVGALVDLVLERAAAARGEEPERPVVEGGAVGWYDCQPDCCTNLRDPDRRALCQRVAQPV